MAGLFRKVLWSTHCVQSLISWLRFQTVLVLQVSPQCLCTKFLVTAPQFARVTVSVDINSKRRFDVCYIFQKADSDFIPVLFCSARYICCESTYDMSLSFFLLALCAVKLKKSSLLLIFRGLEAGTDSSVLGRNVFVKHLFLSRIVFKNKVCEI